MSRCLVAKMQTVWREEDEQVVYHLRLEDEKWCMNDFVGSSVRLTWTGRIFCSNCGNQTKNSFGEGMCYTCFTTAAAASPCIIRPELCEAHLGKGRDVEFEKANHLQPHYVYLAATDVVKVGVTRATQVPTRWMDQGARSAVLLAEVPYRQLAGEIEVAMKSYFTDKTNWKNMLRDIQGETIDLVFEKWNIHEQLPADLGAYWSENDQIFNFNYPVLNYPEKVNSTSFEKVAAVGGKLTGIRGQYLYFDENTVLNLRKHTGYEIEISIND